MRKYYVTYFVCILLTLSCSVGDNPAAEKKYENSTFIHLLFQTEKECMDAQSDPDFFMNCHQQIDFLADNKARVMLTDIIYEAEYQFVGKKVILTFDNNPESSGKEMVLDILNKNTLRNPENQIVWKRLKGDSIWD